MARFDDHFSARAGDYLRYRPQYPPELFAWLASVAPGRHLAWDCGTGNGQAALGLAPHFDRIVATDASAEQLAHAIAHERIEYRLGRAETIALEPGTVDLVTVAAAAHWFDLEAFYRTVRRVAVPDGVLAVWTYHESVITPDVDRLLNRYHDQVLAGFWPRGFDLVIAHYRTLPFPFAAIATPSFEVHARWRLAELIGFLRSWSASQRYRAERGQDPVAIIRPALEQAWGDPERERPIRWPLYLCAGRVKVATLP